VPRAIVDLSLTIRVTLFYRRLSRRQCGNRVASGFPLNDRLYQSGKAEPAMALDAVNF